jgi:hypothetical protein
MKILVQLFHGDVVQEQEGIRMEGKAERNRPDASITQFNAGIGRKS